MLNMISWAVIIYLYAEGVQFISRRSSRAVVNLNFTT